MPKLDRYELLQNEYIEWLLLDKHARAIAGLPTSDEAWCKIKQISDRTVRKWKQHPEFIEKYENRRKEQLLKLPGGTSLQVQGPVKTSKDKSTDSRNEHELIKAKLIERALAGDRPSAELYFKTYGKAYVDEEVASRKSDFRDMDVDQLYERVLTLVPLPVLQAFLEKQGIEQ